MSSLAKIAWAVCLISSVVLLSLGATMQPLQGLRVPLDFYPDGTLKHELLAQEARARDDGTIEAQKVEFRFFSEEGQEEAIIRAADATVDRVGLRGNSEKPVSLSRDQMLLTGEGFEWDGTGETIRILRNVRLAFPSQMFREQTGESHEGSIEE